MDSLSRKPLVDKSTADDEDLSSNESDCSHFNSETSETRSNISIRTARGKPISVKSDDSTKSTFTSKMKEPLSQKSDDSTKSTPVQPKRTTSCSRARRCCSILLHIFKILVFMTFLFFAILILIGFFLAKIEFQCKIDDLGPALYSSIYGQDIAVKKTLDSVTNFCSTPMYDKPLTLVFWGPRGVGKTSFASIFTHNFDSNGQVVPAEYFKASKYKDWFGSRDHNRLFVYTVDDVMSLEEMQDIGANAESFYFPLILVLTTSMESNLLNDSFIRWSENGGDDGNFVYEGRDPTWLAELSHLDPVVVPFLPLSRTTVKLCIEKGLNRLKMKYTKDDVEKIASEFEYFHNSKRLFSKIGCKRLNDKIFSVIAP